MGQAVVQIPEKIYFKIGEVCELVGVQAHVLRYWETEFSQLSPQKNRSGQRSYRRRDVEIALRIKELLYEDMYTIAGARKKLQAEIRGEAPKLKIVHPEPAKAAGSVGKDSTPGLFDEDIDIEDMTEVNDVQNGQSFSMDAEKQDALRDLAGLVLELREMLGSNGGRSGDQSPS